MIDVNLQQEEDIKIKKILYNKLILETNDKKKKGKIKKLILNNKITTDKLSYLVIEKLLNEYHNKKIPNNNIKNIFDNVNYKMYNSKKKFEQEKKHIKLKGINLKRSFKKFFNFRGGDLNENSLNYKTKNKIKEEISSKDKIKIEDKWKKM